MDEIIKMFTGFAPFIGVIVIFYFFLIRPQQKRERIVREMLEALQVGDRVTTIAGIFGKITKIQEDTITIEVGPDKIKLIMARWAIKEKEEDTE